MTDEGLRAQLEGAGEDFLRHRAAAASAVHYEIAVEIYTRAKRRLGG